MVFCILVTFVFPAYALAEETYAYAPRDILFDDSGISTYEKNDALYEKTELRTANTKHIQMSDGKIINIVMYI